MIKIDTGSKRIFRFDNVLEVETCDMLTNYSLSHSLSLKKMRDSNARCGPMPWHDGENIAFSQWTDEKLKTRINAHRILICQLISECFGDYVYPQFSDLVCWKPDKFQPEHVDSEYDGLFYRHYTSVTYCNDNFQGGETFIKNEFGEYFLSIPKKGSVIFYYSDDRTPHGVNKIISGDRVTLPTWFTKDYVYSEKI